VRGLKNIKEKLLFSSLVLVLITLPLPSYSINSQSIIFCILCWMFYNPFSIKIKNIRSNLKIFLLLSSFFWLSIIGLLYTHDFTEGFKNIQKTLPFLVFPLVFSSISVSNEWRFKLLEYYSYGVVIAALFGIIKAFYFKSMNLGNFFYYQQLALLLNKHTTYFALFTVIAIGFFLNYIFQKGWRKSSLYILAILFLVETLYLLSVRVSIIGLILLGVILVIATNKSRNKLGNLGVGVVFIVIFLGYFTTNFQKRFNAKTPEGVSISDLDSRTLHWKSVLEIVAENNLIFGAGTGDGHDRLFDKYLENGYEAGFIHHYNAHNQFLETTLYYGLIGLGLLFFLFFILIKKTYTEKNYLQMAIVIVLGVFMLTESILVRHSGIVVFSFMISMIAFPEAIKK
jgi:O-antigen ligase